MQKSSYVGVYLHNENLGDHGDTTKEGNKDTFRHFCHVLFLPLTNIQVIYRYVGIPRARILKHPSVKQQFGHIVGYNSMSWVK